MLIKAKHKANPAPQEARAQVVQALGPLEVLDRCIYWNSKKGRLAYHQKGHVGDIVYHLPSGVRVWLSMIDLSDYKAIGSRLEYMLEGIASQGQGRVEELLAASL